MIIFNNELQKITIKYYKMLDSNFNFNISTTSKKIQYGSINPLLPSIFNRENLSISNIFNFFL